MPAKLVTSLALIGACVASHMAHSQDPLPRKLRGEQVPLVIAHRGASGYLPEHSQGAKVLAYAQGADILEQDVVLSRDGVFVVAHDITLDKTTDIADWYPDRKRADGHYYYADFDWAELRQLSLVARELSAEEQSGRFQQKYDQRMVRLDDEIRLIQELNRLFHRNVGLHIELKAPAFHRQEFGGYMSERLMPILDEFGYRSDRDLCFIQCFEFEELRHLRQNLNCRLQLIQLIGGSPMMLTDPPSAGSEEKMSRSAWAARIVSQLPALAEIVNGIGPSLELVAELQQDGSIRSSGLVEAAHAMQLCVHPYTVRADGLPTWASSLDQLHHWIFEELQVDGVFTDFPDLSLAYRGQRQGK